MIFMLTFNVSKILVSVVTYSVTYSVTNLVTYSVTKLVTIPYCDQLKLIQRSTINGM